MLVFKQKTPYQYNIYDTEIDTCIGEIYRTYLNIWYLELNERCCGLHLLDIRLIHEKMEQLHQSVDQESYFKHQKELLE